MVAHKKSTMFINKLVNLVFVNDQATHIFCVLCTLTILGKLLGFTVHLDCISGSYVWCTNLDQSTVHHPQFPCNLLWHAICELFWTLFQSVAISCMNWAGKVFILHGDKIFYKSKKVVSTLTLGHQKSIYYLLKCKQLRQQIYYTHWWQQLLN